VFRRRVRSPIALIGALSLREGVTCFLDDGLVERLGQEFVPWLSQNTNLADAWSGDF
jgi:hypothetical protein